MALSASRNTPRRDGVSTAIGLAANVTCHQGGIVVVDATGYAMPAKTALNLVAMGIAELSATNGAVAGEVRAQVRSGTFRFGSAGGPDQIGQAQLGRVVYLVDDETVAATNGTNTRSPAGVCVDIDPAGIWVAIGPTIRQA